MYELESKETGFNALRLIVLATAVTVIVNVFLILPGSYDKLIYGAIQFIWTAIAIFLLIRIYYSSIDRSVRSLALSFGVALVPWTLTLLLWQIILPMLNGDDLAYYVSGFGYLACYFIIVYGLFVLIQTRKRRLDGSRNLLINMASLATVFVISLLIVWNMNWNSPRVADILILLAYLAVDIVILSLCLKLANMDLSPELKYLVLIIAEFVSINFIGDVLFELRWLLPLSYLFSYKISFLTNVIYNIALVFLVIALLLYNFRLARRALDKMNTMLDDSKLLIGEMIKHSPDAMCVCDASGCAIAVNDLFLKTFNIQDPTLSGNFNIFKYLADMDWFRSNEEKIERGEIVVLPWIELYPGRDGGESRYASVKVYPIYGSEGDLSKYVCIFEDTTEKVRMNQDLEDMKNQAELYVDLMGHDINNMNQVAFGYLELALDKLNGEGKLDKESEFLISRPYEALKNSSLLIENVRKIRKEKSGAYKPEIIDVGAVLKEIKEQYSSAPGKDITVEFNEDCKCSVKANELLRDVFSNVVGNAVKHSSHSVDIQILMDKVVVDGTEYCRVMIDDNGPGIPDHIKKTLFDRLSLSNTKMSGKGLGLCLIKMLVDDYQGKFWVEDRVQGDYKKGCRFVIMLPAANIQA